MSGRTRPHLEHHRHTASHHKCAAAFRGLYDNAVNIVAVGIGLGFKVGAADKVDHPAAAVDAEFGRVVAAADAVDTAAPVTLGVTCVV